MTTTEFIKVMIKLIKENYSLELKEQGLEEYIDDVVSFIDKDEQFRNLINSEKVEDIEKLNDLSKDLSILKEKLEYFCKLNHIKDTSFFNISAYIILNFKPNIFNNKKILSDFNQEVGKEVFVSHFYYDKFISDYSNLIDSFDTNKIDTKKMDVKSIAFRVHKIIFDVNYFKKLKIILNIINIVSSCYKENDYSIIQRIFEVNNLCINFDSRIRNNKLPNIYLFHVLYNYKDMLKNKFIDDPKRQKIFLELFDKNSCFNELQPYEIVLLIYEYFFLYESYEEILSKKEEYVFKDLSPIVKFIRMKNKEGIDSAKIINDLASGKIKINLKEKQEKNIKK